MARGSIAKKEITEKILSVFPNSFIYNDGKEIRIPVFEEDAEVQIKVTLTAAKVNVTAGTDTAIPTSSTQESAFDNKIEITEEEKKETISLIDRLGL